MNTEEQQVFERVQFDIALITKGKLDREDNLTLATYILDRLRQQDK